MPQQEAHRYSILVTEEQYELIKEALKIKLRIQQADFSFLETLAFFWNLTSADRTLVSNYVQSLKQIFSLNQIKNTTHFSDQLTKEKKLTASLIRTLSKDSKSTKVRRAENPTHSETEPTKLEAVIWDLEELANQSHSVPIEKP